MDYFQLMNDSCKDVNILFDEEKYKKFMDYMVLLKEWNEKINLTAITDQEQIVKKHFIDSIKIFKFLGINNCKPKSVIDIGTGAGFPGIPMKIVAPEINMVLLDSLNKRVNFLNEVTNKLELNNINAIHGRAEDFGRDVKYREKFDFAVSRAVANLSSLLEFSLPFVKINGYFIAMKGPSVNEEILSSKKAMSLLGGKLEDIIKVDIEDTDLQHNLLVIKKIKNTPVNYPRKAGMVTKEPIK